MSLNNNVKNVIRCIADNDIQKAKAYVKIIIDSEKAEANKSFCKSIKTKLESQANNFIELPHDIQGILKMEDVGVSFNENRYYLTTREQELASKIFTTKNVVDKLSEMGIRYVNSTLLYGESGTGKTTFGRYVAYKLGLPFAYVSFAECISSYLGNTAKNLNKVFDYVKKSPCVLMLDEIDAIGIKRDKSNEVGEMARIVIGLMQAFDLLENNVIVIGATNKPNILDEALQRRFTNKHEVKVLEESEVKNFIIQFLDDVEVKYDVRGLDGFIGNSSKKQSEIVNNIIDRIIKSIETNSVVNFE